MNAKAEQDRSPGGFQVVEKRQTGCCPEAQADGIPCPSPECDCEACSRSALERPASRRKG